MWEKGLHSGTLTGKPLHRGRIQGQSYKVLEIKLTPLGGINRGYQRQGDHKIRVPNIGLTQKQGLLKIQCLIQYRAYSKYKAYILKISLYDRRHVQLKNGTKTKFLSTRRKHRNWRKLKKYFPKASIFSSVPLNKCNGQKNSMPAVSQAV